MKETMINYNFHQHTQFSDGKETPEKYAKKAIKLGMKAIGFSEHSPLPFPNPFSLQEENIEEYIRQTEELKVKFIDKLKIYRALEMDFIPGMSEDFDYWRERCKVDYLIGSLHLVKADGYEELWFTDGPDWKIYDQGIKDFFGGDVKKAVKQFYLQTNAMIESQKFEIIGHFDKIKMHNRNRFFTDKDKWYRDLIDEAVDLIKQKDLIVEINTRGLYKKRSDELFPDGYALQRVKELSIPIIISSDAHHPDELMMLFEFAQKRLIEIGFQSVMDFKNGLWTEKELT
jgi:histidinol-phosphatase (PHP family)